MLTDRPEIAEELPPEVDQFMRDRASRILIASIRACHPEDAVDIMTAALEGARAGIPEANDIFGYAREDAAFWADCATPPELEAVVAAGLRKIERREFCQAARKRIFAAIWESFADDDRRAFLSRVDPGGKFRGKS